MEKGEKEFHRGKENKAKRSKKGGKGTDLEKMKWEEKRQQREERENSIRKTKYNKCYKEIVEEGIPIYLREGRKEEKSSKISIGQ